MLELSMALLLVGSEGTWLEVNGGVAFTISENLSAFGDVSYNFDVEDSDRNLFGGQIGLKVRW
jgi:outer membrane autotransporter protein